MNKIVSRTPKVFMYGYYGYSNVGDDLLVSTIISRISILAPQAQFIIRSIYSVSGLASDNIHYIDTEKHITNGKGPRWLRVTKYAWNTWRSLRECTHLVFGGGTLFHARSGSKVSLALMAMLVIMSRLRGIKVFALGVGVARLPAGIAKILMGIVLNSAQDFAVRDKSSMQNCQNIFGSSNIRITSDLIFSISLNAASRDFNARPVLGITLAASDIGNDGSGKRNFLDALGSALEILYAQGWTICFLTFQEFSSTNINLSDSALFQTLTCFELKKKVEIVSVSSKPSEIARQFSGIDIVAGMRFHGHVVAALMGKPFVGISQDSKVEDLCKFLSMPFLDIDKFQVEQFVSVVEQVNSSVPNKNKISILSDSANANFDNILDSLL
jgi:polysaccharide pyruvyl transferase WcaK-like protein